MNMPNRVVREGIIKSDLVNKLNFGAEVFYRRLMSVADDFGRTDGRASILRSELYALRVDSITLDEVEGWKKDCVSAGVIRIYRVEGKEYILILNFNQRMRAMKSKYPEPPADTCQSPADTCQTKDSHPPSDAGACRLESETEAEVETEAEGEAEGQTAAPFYDKGWMQYPRAEMAIELTETELTASVEWIYHLRQILLTNARINDFWKAFRLKLNGRKYYASRSDLIQHFREWLKTQKIEAQSAGPKTESSTAEQIRQARAKLNQP